MPNEYEEFIKTTDLKIDSEDDLQFYLDGYDEEHGEIHGVIKRMRRGDYDKRGGVGGLRCSEYLIKYGLKTTIFNVSNLRNGYIQLPTHFIGVVLKHGAVDKRTLVKVV